MCAHGCRLTGKMTGDGAVLIDCASVITLVESSVITLVQSTEVRVAECALDPSKTGHEGSTGRECNHIVYDREVLTTHLRFEQ